MGTLTSLTHQPGFNASTMLLLTDGTVMCQGVTRRCITHRRSWLEFVEYLQIFRPLGRTSATHRRACCRTGAS